MYEKQSEVVIEMAKHLIDLAQDIEPNWEAAYYRFCINGAESEANGSYICDASAELIGALTYDGFYQAMGTLSEKLFSMLKKERGVLLLKADSHYNYGINFDFDDLGKWKITKLGGASGIPGE